MHARDYFVNVWNNVDAVRFWAAWLPYVLIAIGGIVGMSGQYVRTRFDARVKVLDAAASAAAKKAAEAADAQRKATPPAFEAAIILDPQKGPAVIILTKNLTPFRAKWVFTRENNVILGGIMLDWHEFHPNKVPQQFYSLGAERPGAGQVIELRMDYESLYAAELHNPPGLSGRVVKRYRQTADGAYDPIP